MTATLQLLERYKDLKHLRSNYAAAKALGISQNTISKWKAGGTMDETTALQIAHEIGADPLATLAAVRLERPVTTRERRIWERYRARLSVALVATIAIGGASPVEYADAKDADYNYVNRHLIHYAQLTIIALLTLRATKTAFRWLAHAITSATAIKALLVQSLRSLRYDRYAARSRAALTAAAFS